jgi:uncharacterized membrane protein
VTVPIALGTGIIFVTVAVTVARYADLPKRIPIHFGIDGSVDGYGPRLAVWLLVAIQVAIALSTTVPYMGGSPRRTVLWSDALLVICLAAQLQVISAAMSGKSRVNTIYFWIVFAAAMAVGVAAASGRLG